MVAFSTWLLPILGCIPHVLAAPSVPRALAYRSHPERTNAVKQAFQRAWTGYRKYAFPHDNLLPISESYVDDLGGWGASAIDALSTALILGNEEAVSQIVDHVQKINFKEGSGTISLFETTIRYLGGLLSAHDLLSGPLRNNNVNATALAAILDQAVHLADLLSVGFNTTTGIPVNDLVFQLPAPVQTDESTNGIATIGTLVLEWTRLSDKTGSTKYAELAQKAQSYLLNPKPALGQPFPGLLGTDVSIADGTFTDSGGGWGGGDDSFYEYLIKMYLYDQSRFGAYKDRWIVAIDSTIKYIASHPTTRPDLTFLAGWYNSQELYFGSGHLACFAGGNIILGGLTLNRGDYVQFGLEVVKGCRQTYAATSTGIGPEGFAWQDNKAPLDASWNPPVPDDQAEFYNTSGFWLISGAEYYDLRPEVIESYYYAYRATGDSKYQDWAWEAFLKINATCAVGVGYGGLENVNTPDHGGNFDKQESFFFAEVLKYSYLIQAGEAPYQVSASHDNEWVFNTEAHPMKVAGTPI